MKSALAILLMIGLSGYMAYSIDGIRFVFPYLYGFIGGGMTVFVLFVGNGR